MITTAESYEITLRLEGDEVADLDRWAIHLGHSREAVIAHVVMDALSQPCPVRETIDL